MYFTFIVLVTQFVMLITFDKNNAGNNDDRCLINSGVSGKQILGDYRVSENIVPYCAFLGIPYARPPIGKFRFKPPKSTDFLYDLVSIYTSPGYPCIFRKDLGITTGNQSEDCLYLNIFVPLNVLRSDQTNAVVIWIHGGSYNVGSGLSDMHPIQGPESLIENGMIFVSFNYRLGALGFLRVPELNITGNYGLMDQRLALKWVHTNIHLWNGNKMNITVMGWSAGSASASYHLFARKSKRYFKRVILMSGSLYNSWAQYDHPDLCLNQLLKVLQIKRRHISRLLKINGTDFDRDVSSFGLTFGISNVCFVPTVDDVMVNDTIDLKLDKQVDIMIGWTKLEFQHNLFNFVSQKQELFNPSEFWLDHKEAHRLTKYLEYEFYNNTDKYLRLVDSSSLTSNVTNTFYQLVTKLMSEDHMKYGIREFIKDLQQSNKVQTLNMFVYQFSYDGPFSTNPKFVDGLKGAGHGDDLGYLYRTEQNLRGANTNYDAEYKKDVFVQSSLIKMWINFIKHGHPTPKPIASSLNDSDGSVIWKKYRVRSRLMNIDVPIKMVPDLDDVFYQLIVRLVNCIRYNVCSFLDECLHCG